MACAILGAGFPAAQAADLPGALTRQDAVLAIMQTLGVPASRMTPDAETRRLPAALQPYFTSAVNRHALTVFGKTFNGTQPMTRGEAVLFLQAFSNYTQKDTDVPDLLDLKRAKGDMRIAVDIALEQHWLKPLRKDQFGIAAPFTSRDLREVLTSLRGEPVNIHGKTIVVPITRVKPDQPSQPTAQESEKLLRNVLGILNSRYYYSEKFDQTEALYRAAEAIAESAHDPYTVFSKPSRAEINRSELEGELEGIGASVELKKNTDNQQILTVIAPLPGSPALDAGLQPGDEIVQVDGTSIIGLSLEDAVGKIRGKSGTSVTITVRRSGMEFTKTIVRAKVDIPEIERQAVGTVEIVRLVQFGKITHDQFRSTMQDVMKKNPTGIVLDLRNNPGGYLDSAERVCSAFLPKSSVFATVKMADGSAEDESTLDDAVVPSSIPLVVLVNNGSASASEIVAGALQDVGRAKIVGEKTFGKGSVQQIYDVGGGATLKVTVAKWFTPKNRGIDGQGIAPDVTVEGAGDRDEQLLKALDLLR